MASMPYNIWRIGGKNAHIQASGKLQDEPID
jgi:hypothetical protein